MTTKAYISRVANCSCNQCDIEFYKTPSLIKNSINNFCSLECRGLFNRKRVTVNCFTCNKTFDKILCNANRTKKSFCSQECYYKCPDKINHFTCHKSKAEEFLYSLIKQDFPELKINQNDTDILNNGLEIDICIPDKLFAIELNGPTHYTEIFGYDNLLKTQDRDSRKMYGLTLLGYQLLVINISSFKNLKQAKPHIQQEYYTKIKTKLLQTN